MLTCVCECLNVIAKISDVGPERPNSLKFGNGSPALNDAACFEALEFLKSALGPLKGQISVQHDALVQQIKLNNWTINHCLNCDSYVYATGEGVNGDKFLINGNLLRDEAQLITLMNCDKYSMPFKIILKPIDALPGALNMSISDDARVKPLFDKLQDYIQMDTIRTEEEIRRLKAEMDQRRQKAERDFQRIATLIKSTRLIESTKTLPNENIESLTPPVTPESINDKMMSMESQLSMPQPMKISKSKVMSRDQGFAKHNNAIHQQHITRAIDFEDDIFEFDGMHNCPKTEIERHPTYSDTDETSDGELVVEKRGNNRGRSGSMARSAPISMPQFTHAVHIDNEDGKPVIEEQMDIASSIQMLARSIHVDSVFGEKPARPTLRYNTEF